MASVCISNCINDARLPVRPTYINLYKWPESDAEFIRSVSSKLNRTSRVVDSISCRQMYLRSYTFSREEEHAPETKTNKCFAKVGMRQKISRRKKKKTVAAESSNGDEKIRKPSRLRKAKEISCAALTSVFRRLLSCTAKVDVADTMRESTMEFSEDGKVMVYGQIM